MAKLNKARHEYHQKVNQLSTKKEKIIVSEQEQNIWNNEKDMFWKQLRIFDQVFFFDLFDILLPFNCYELPY